MTLVEVLIASVLLGIGVTGLVSAAALTMRNQQRTEQRDAALCLAQEKIAEVEITGAYIWLLEYPTSGKQERDQTVYQWKIDIEQQTVGELFTVRTAVSWMAPNGNGSVELETWLNDYEAVSNLPNEQRGRNNPIEADAQSGR
jgi:Tfp pilus assembly protein PilV